MLKYNIIQDSDKSVGIEITTDSGVITGTYPSRFSASSTKLGFVSMVGPVSFSDLPVEDLSIEGVPQSDSRVATIALNEFVGNFTKGVVPPPPVTPNLQSVTDAGSSTTHPISVGEATATSQAVTLGQLNSVVDEISKFRGYFETKNELDLVPHPTENDFAYLVEIIPPATTSNQWIYIGGNWTDTGIKVPDQVTPASDNLPLKDSRASSGVGTSYSRWDHIHPETNLPSGSIPVSDGFEYLVSRFIQTSSETQVKNAEDQLVIRAQNDNLHLSSPNNAHGISINDAAGLTYDGRVVATDFPGKIIFVDNTVIPGDTTRTGSASLPFKTIMEAVNSAPFGSSIRISPGEYTENIVLNNKSNISIKGEGTIGQYRTVITGNITISGTSTSVGLDTLSFSTNCIKSANGTFYVDNCAFNAGMTITGTGYSRWDFCFIQGVLAHNSNAFLDLFNCQFENEAVINAGAISGATAANKRIYLQDCLNVTAIHSAGTFISIGGTNFVRTSGSTLCIQSNASISNGALFLLGGSTFNGTSYAEILKNGTAPYAIGGMFQYEPQASSFNGVRTDSGLHSEQIYDHNARSGYTRVNDTLKSHLDGISNSLLSKPIYSTARSYYVNSSTGLDTNDGLSVGTPKQTIQSVLETLNSSIYTKFSYIQINLSSGSYVYKSGGQFLSANTFKNNVDLPIIILGQGVTTQLKLENSLKEQIYIQGVTIVGEGKLYNSNIAFRNLWMSGRLILVDSTLSITGNLIFMNSIDITGISGLFLSDGGSVNLGGYGNTVDSSYTITYDPSFTHTGSTFTIQSGVCMSFRKPATITPHSIYAGNFVNIYNTSSVACGDFDPSVILPKNKIALLDVLSTEQKLGNSQIFVNPSIINSKNIDGIANDLTTYDHTKVLSAEQGVIIGRSLNILLKDYWYGVERDESVISSKATRIGMMDLHRSLPIQNKMRRCLLRDDGLVNYYLDQNNSLLKEDGSQAILDGSDGQVMVEIPEHYYKCEYSGTIRRDKLSEYPLEGFTYYHKHYVGAFQSTVQRSTLKACSVINTTPDYRGGNNDATKDETDMTYLGKNADSLSMTNWRTYTRNRGSLNWNVRTVKSYAAYVHLAYIEFSNTNIQLAVNDTLTAEGYRQGGLGPGISFWPPTIESYNGGHSILPCGYTTALGNNSGQVPFIFPTSLAELNPTPPQVYVQSYRGIETPYGHNWEYTDGSKVEKTSTDVFIRVTDNPDKFGSSLVSDYNLLATIPNISYTAVVKTLEPLPNGEIIPTSVISPAGTLDYYSDLMYSNVGLGVGFVIAYGGRVIGRAECGLFNSSYDHPVTLGIGGFTTRLCYLPNY